MNETAKRYAIITPYFKEERHLLERCIRSVHAQTHPADHFMIADGHPQSWIDSERVRHIKLDRSHANFGNTPRAVGAVMASSEGYDGIGLLDAENWLESDHVASCIEAAERSELCDYVIAQRNMYRPDGSLLDVKDESLRTLVDTNCFFLLPGSYHVIPHFGLTPNELSPVCDRVFAFALRERHLQAEIVDRKTVNYLCLWAGPYRKAGEIPPPEANHNLDSGEILRWLQAQSPRELEVSFRLAGCTINFPKSGSE